MLVQISGGGWKLTITERKRILLDNIYGVDIDAQAVETTKLSLLLKVLEGETSQTIQPELLHERALPDLGDNIKCGNSLIGPDFYQQSELPLLTDEERYRINVFDWHAEFPEVFKAGGFDAVISNPPYIFTRELIQQHEKDYYNKSYKQTQFKINTYLLFVEKSFYLLREDGTAGFIIPNNWLTLETASRFRYFILKDTGGIRIVNCRDRVFKGASVDTSILTFGKTGDRETAIYELKNGKFNAIVKNKSDFYLSLHNHVLVYGSNHSNQNGDLCEKISKQGIFLDKIAEVRNGIQAYTVGEGTPVQTKQMKENRVYHSLEKKDESWLKYVDGVDVKRYQCGWSKQFVKYGENLTRPRKRELFNGERLLVRQIPASPPYSILGCYVNESLVNDNNSMVVINCKFPYSLKYLLGVINSRLISFWFINSFGKLQRKIFPQFKVKEFRIFPIHSLSANRD